MPEARSRSFTIEAKFVAYDPNLISPKKANVLIRRMEKALADFKLANQYIQAYVLVIDEFQCHQVNTNLIKGSWKLRVELVDSNIDNGAIGRFNVDNSGGFRKAICELKFHKYQTVIKIVDSYDDIGDLTVDDAVLESGNEKPGASTMGDQKYDFFERFTKSITKYSFLARVLVLEKELERLKGDSSLTEEAKETLVKKTDMAINSLKQNMSEEEIAEMMYFAVSLDLIPGI